MKTPLTLLLFILLFCTCVRAQNIDESQQFTSVTTLSFIKPMAGKLPFDSLTVSTSLDENAYGFPFVSDTVVLDVNTFPPVDELTVELFSAGRSLGVRSFWAGGAYADVHLSLLGNRTKIDSVTYSTAHTWYLEQLAILRKAKGLFGLALELQHSAAITRDGIMSLAFANALLDLPNMSPGKVWQMREEFIPSISPIVQKHPRYAEFVDRVNIIGRKCPNFKRFGFLRPSGGSGTVQVPQDTKFYVVNLYDSTSPASRQVHQQIKGSPVLDSLFTQVAPMISISTDASPALWRVYAKDNAFSWQHYLMVKSGKKTFAESLPIKNKSVFLLVDSNHRIFGAYHSFQALVNVVRMKTSGLEPYTLVLPAVY